MEISFVAHDRILPLLEPRLPQGVFPAYVCTKASDGVSLAVTTGSQVQGALVDGARFGLFEAVGPWLFANTPQAARRLLDEVANTGIPHGLEFSPEHQELVRLRFPAATLSQDVLLSLEASDWRKNDEAMGSVVQLCEGDPRWTLLTPALRRQVGTLDGITPESPLWGWQLEDRVVAVAETLVRNGRFACFGQVVTDPDFQRMGFAQSLVSRVSAFLLEQGFTPLWLAAESNAVSLRLAEKLGFRECARFGCVEYGDVPEAMADIE